MTPLQIATVPESERRAYIEDALRLWKAGDSDVRSQYPASDPVAAHAAMLDEMAKLKQEIVFQNDLYQVHVRKVHPRLLHLSIRRLDREPIHDWRDLQEIKNQLVGPECEAVELYPAESRLQDSANQFHLWAVPDASYRFPLGFTWPRLVTDRSIGKSRNRPLRKEPL